MVMRITVRGRTWISEAGSTAVLMVEVVVMGIKNKRGVDERRVKSLVYGCCGEEEELKE